MCRQPYGSMRVPVAQARPHAPSPGSLTTGGLLSGTCVHTTLLQALTQVLPFLLQVFQRLQPVLQVFALLLLRRRQRPAALVPPLPRRQGGRRRGHRLPLLRLEPLLAFPLQPRLQPAGYELVQSLAPDAPLACGRSKWLEQPAGILCEDICLLSPHADAFAARRMCCIRREQRDEAQSPCFYRSMCDSICRQHRVTSLRPHPRDSSSSG